ncbi:centromere protein M-like [Saccoglossus kowalevskii]|uniref:Centromere protein M n=1 Tax=Saccoglossus kowalevskii TaxID=10224 RepID=A0ABM0MXF6_SACKO|nr:PREDICTED: centromere protein M-like [Saccoglossus kowalevskii]
MSKLLSTFNKVSAPNTATVLLVGAEGTSKHKLAEAMLNIDTDFNLNMLTASSLPLPKDESDSRPPVNFVVFVIDLSNVLSMTIVESSVKYLDVDYFLGRCCFVVMKAEDPDNQNVEMMAVTGLSDVYQSPMLCGDVKTIRNCQCLARKLLSMVEIAGGFKFGVTPLLIDATRNTFNFEEEL